MEDLEIAGSTVLITGGAGFIGSHLVKELVKRKAKVVITDLIIHPQSFFAVENLKKDTIYKKVDIRDKEQVSHIFKTYTPQYIFHLAAEPIVATSYDNPYNTFMTNIIGTVNILDACRYNSKTKAVIVASSDKAYGKTKKPYRETSPLQGDHPYDVSKSCTDLIAQTYYKTYGLPVIITRFGNVYGEGDIHFDRIIPGLCKSILKNEVLDIRSDGTYIRDYIYAGDVVLAYILLLKKYNKIAGEAFNVSADVSFTVLTLIKKTERVLKRKVSYKILNTARNEIPYQHLLNKKIKKLCWKASFSLEKRHQNTFAWYANNLFKDSTNV